jgi:hypothetical protein
MAKVAKLVLTYPHCPIDAPDRKYRVVRSQHTTEFNPGEYLTKEQVDELNLSNRWDITVVSKEK